MLNSNNITIFSLIMLNLSFYVIDFDIKIEFKLSGIQAQFELDKVKLVLREFKLNSFERS